MKATRNLCILFVLFLCVGSGMFYSFKNDPQKVKESQKEVFALIDQFGTAIRSSIHRLKISPIIIAKVADVPYYRNEPPAKDRSYEFECSWGPDGESNFEGTVSMKEYNSHGYYREVNVKQSGDKPCERTYKTGYESKTANENKTGNESKTGYERIKDQNLKGREVDGKAGK